MKAARWHEARGAAADRRHIKALVSGLYDGDMGRRIASARALGEISRRDPEYIRKMWPRIFYAFDDTMSCWGAAEGLGEIGRNVPRLRDRIMLLLRKFQRDASSCQGYIWAVTEAAGNIRRFLGDGRRTWIYDNETARMESLSEIASEALAKL
jgi:hypothetical protein